MAQPSFASSAVVTTLPIWSETKQRPRMGSRCSLGERQQSFHTCSVSKASPWIPHRAQWQATPTICSIRKTSSNGIHDAHLVIIPAYFEAQASAQCNWNNTESQIPIPSTHSGSSTMVTVLHLACGPVVHVRSVRPGRSAKEQFRHWKATPPKRLFDLSIPKKYHSARPRPVLPIRWKYHAIFAFIVCFSMRCFSCYIYPRARKACNNNIIKRIVCTSRWRTFRPWLTVKAYPHCILPILTPVSINDAPFQPARCPKPLPKCLWKSKTSNS